MTRDELRQYDANAIAGGIPGIALMESAGRGICDLLLSLGIDGPVGVVVGKGNNGGDGFVIARHLVDRGWPAHLEMLHDPNQLVGDARQAYEGACYVQIPMFVASSDWEAMARRLSGCSWIVDAILGTGSQGPLRSPADRAIQMINRSGRRVLAVDLPSGLDADTGEPNDPTIRAEHTATLVARKRGFDRPQSTTYTGIVHVIPLGAGRRDGVRVTPML
jgi:NAD(P)H-hydrate epimerase